MSWCAWLTSGWQTISIRCAIKNAFVNDKHNGIQIFKSSNIIQKFSFVSLPLSRNFRLHLCRYRDRGVWWLCRLNPILDLIFNGISLNVTSNKTSMWLMGFIKLFKTKFPHSCIGEWGNIGIRSQYHNSMRFKCRPSDILRMKLNVSLDFVNYRNNWSGNSKWSSQLVNFEISMLLSSYKIALTHLSCAAYMRQGTGSTLAEEMPCRLVGTKPLPEPMMVHRQLTP